MPKLKERVFVVDGEEFKTSKAREIHFIEAMEQAGIPWRTYSGRGMFGRVCPAACSSRSDNICEGDIVAAAKEHGVGKLCTDDMGLDTVYYTG